jgi:pyruvate,water dikinase
MIEPSATRTAVDIFPVYWDDPVEALRYWHHPSQLFPHQLTPLEFEAFACYMMDGIGHAAEKLGLPIRGVRGRRINTFFYRSVIIKDDSAASPADKDAGLQRAADDLARAWKEDYLPEIRDYLDEFAALDLVTLPLSRLAMVFDRALRWMQRLWELHYLIVFPAHAAINEFVDAYRALFGTGTALGPYQLLGGIPNKTVEAGQALWQLSRYAAKSARLRQLLKTTAIEDVPGKLRHSDEGRRLADRIGDYLTTYGRRGDLCSLTAVSWIEDPTPVIRNLITYLDRPTDAAPEQAVVRAAATRDSAVAQAHRRLEGYPRQVVELFDRLLAAAQSGTALTEDHTFYIDYGGIYPIRRVILEIGRRLTGAGMLDTPDEVFLLGIQQVRGALTTADPVTTQATLAGNRTEMQWFAAVSPPPVLGNGQPPRIQGAFGRLNRNFTGAPKIDAQQEDAPVELGMVRGLAGSAGTARGNARIVRTLAEADRLVPGEVLVAPTTAPSWTPLFTVAAAVVTDTGGVLSHCAVVAREYGLPAVVGATGATSRIPNGQLVEVDGNTGVVRILEPS